MLYTAATKAARLSFAPLKASSRYIRGPSCTNNEIGPLSEGNLGALFRCINHVTADGVQLVCKAI